MTGRLLSPGTYGYNDVLRGDRIETAAALITADLIDRFADLTGDRFAIHMSDAAARTYGFPARVAHGLLVLSVVDGLKNQCPVQFDAIASLGWTWDFLRPVFVGDMVRATLTVSSKRPTKNPERGILRLAVFVTRNGAEVVGAGQNKLMVKRREEVNRSLK